jgi:hypothetical protein
MFLSLLLLIIYNCFLFFSYTMALVKMAYNIIRILFTHESDTTCSIIWMTIYNLNIGFNNIRNRCICFRKVLSQLLTTATIQTSAFFLYVIYFTFESTSRHKYLKSRRNKKWKLYLLQMYYYEHTISYKYSSFPTHRTFTLLSEVQVIPSNIYILTRLPCMW